MEQANALHPDLILLGGDYVCADVEAICELAPILGPLNAKYGVFAVLGNYDCLLGPELIRSQLVAQSIEVLVNRGLHVGPSAGQFFLAGLDSVLGGVPDPIRAFGSCREGNVALALVHEPDYFSMLVGLTPVDVQLSGHSHGGQVQTPGSRPGDPAALGPDLPHGPLRTERALCLHRARPWAWWDYRCGLIVLRNLV